MSGGPRPGWATAFWCALTVLGCTDGRAPGDAIQPSPNARILPEPLASASDLSGAPIGAQVDPSGGSSAGAGREPAPGDSAGRVAVVLPPEMPRLDAPLPSDPVALKESAGYVLDAQFRWADLPEAPAGTEAPTTALREALETRSHSMGLLLSASGRLRVRLASKAFPLPEGTELRARTSLFGHTLVWPGAAAYRVLAPGSLRALLTERRADVSPLLRAKVTPAGASSALGHRTLRTEVETSLGTVTLDQTTLPGAAGGELLCRLLLELAGAEPSPELCRPDRIPLSATFRWIPSGSLTFSVTSLLEQKDLPATHLQVPPPASDWKPGELPPSGNVLATASELGKLRGRPRPADVRQPGAPQEGLLADNSTARLLYVLVDGLTVAWVAPRSRVALPELPAGRHSITWRDFLGTFVAPPTDVDAPALAHASPPPADGGAPH